MKLLLLITIVPLTYLLIGIILAIIVSYFDRRDHDLDGAIIFAFALFWPIVLLMVGASFILDLCDWVKEKLGE